MERGGGGAGGRGRWSGVGVNRSYLKRGWDGDGVGGEFVILWPKYRIRSMDVLLSFIRLLVAC